MKSVGNAPAQFRCGSALSRRLSDKRDVVVAGSGSSSSAGAWLSSGFSKLHTLTIGCLTSFPLVRMVTSRTLLSSPGCSAVIRPRGHLVGGSPLSLTRTSSPTAGLIRSFFHLVRCCKCVKYSDVQRFQKLWWSLVRRSHLLTGLTSRITGSGGATNGLPIRKCPGVRAARSAGSLLTANKGLELTHASICERMVMNSS